MVMVNVYKSFAQAAFYWKRNKISAKLKIEFLRNNPADIFNSKKFYLKETSWMKYFLLSTVYIFSSKKKFLDCNWSFQKFPRLAWNI